MEEVKVFAEFLLAEAEEMSMNLTSGTPNPPIRKTCGEKFGNARTP